MDATTQGTRVKRVLMIDDDDMMRILFRDTFWIHSSKDHMVEVETVRSITEAREYLAQSDTPPHVIFIGLLLLTRGPDGAMVREPLPSLEFIKDLRTRDEYKDACIVVYSRYSESEFQERAKEAGANHYIVKGELTPREIVDFVEKI